MNLKRKWHMFLPLLLIGFPVQSVMAQATLKGVVADEKGEPLKDASVWIQTATPKSGTGYL